MGVLWVGYTGGLWGYCLVRGYNVGLGQLVNPLHQFQWKKPMPLAGNTVIFPNGSAGDTASHNLTVVGGNVTARPPSPALGTARPARTGVTPVSRAVP